MAKAMDVAIFSRGVFALLLCLLVALTRADELSLGNFLLNSRVLKHSFIFIFTAKVLGETIKYVKDYECFDT